MPTYLSRLYHWWVKTKQWCLNFRRTTSRSSIWVPLKWKVKTNGTGCRAFSIQFRWKHAFLWTRKMFRLCVILTAGYRSITPKEKRIRIYSPLFHCTLTNLGEDNAPCKNILTTHNATMLIRNHISIDFTYNFCVDQFFCYIPRKTLYNIK
jgi:hypothetical protein